MLKILAVDDSKAVHAYLDLSLKGKAATLIHVFHGGEALQKLGESSTDFDLILMDWEMPVLDGPSTLLQLKARKNTTPILMMTTKNNPEDILKALELGASEYMLKPFTGDILIEKIRQTVGQDLSHAA